MLVSNANAAKNERYLVRISLGSGVGPVAFNPPVE